MPRAVKRKDRATWSVSPGGIRCAAKGDVNTTRSSRNTTAPVKSPKAAPGFIVPPGLATDDTTKAFFQSLVTGSALASLYEFENEEIFSPLNSPRPFIVCHRHRNDWCNQRQTSSFSTRHHLKDREAFYADSGRLRCAQSEHPNLSDISRRRDAGNQSAIYRRAGILWREESEDGNLWDCAFSACLDMAMDSDLFRTQSDLLSAGVGVSQMSFIWASSAFAARRSEDGSSLRSSILEPMKDRPKRRKTKAKLPEFDDTAHADPNRLTIPYYWIDSAAVD